MPRNDAKMLLTDRTGAIKSGRTKTDSNDSMVAGSFIRSRVE